MKALISDIAVIPTVEPPISVHVLPAAIAGNGLCLQIHNAGKIAGRAYVDWKDVPLLEEAIRRARDRSDEQMEEWA